MSRRVLLVCPEPLGHGQPAGVGIRFLEIARVLQGDGHDVTVLSPDAAPVSGCTSGFVNPETLLASSSRSDAAVVQGHAANAFFQQAHPIPTVVDLYDPYIIENLHYFAERGAEVFRHDHFTLATSLVRGDFFLCASEAQRLFYLGALLAAGRLNPELFEADPDLRSLIDVAPFGVPPPRPVTRRTGRNILFGGVYDWYDPIAAIDAVAIARRTLPGATLTFTMHPNPEITPQGKLAEAIAYARSRGHDFVRFEPWAPYADRAAFFERFAMALITFPRSLETDLSMRTRIYDYLWCGLPIVSSPAPGTDEILHRYHAGLVVADATPEAYAAAIVASGATQTSAGMQQFAEDHQWNRTLAPLRAFCRAPRMERTKETFVTPPAIPERPSSVLSRLKRRLR